MIPRDCSVVIPPFYRKHLKDLAYGVGKMQRVAREFVADLEQEAIVAFLANVGVHRLANPSQKHWNEIRPAIIKEVTRLAHEETRKDESVEDYPGLLDGLEEPAQEAPTWIPGAPAERRLLVEKCRELLRNSVNPGRSGKRSTYRVDIILMGAHVVMSGNFKTKREAQMARRQALRNIIEWCLPIGDEEEGASGAAQFLALHAGARAKPAIFYGDPLACLIYLEEFGERVHFGHRYS